VDRVVSSPSSSSQARAEVRADRSCLSGGGVTGALVRSLDWSETVLGPISTWSNSLTSTVGMLLHSRHPMFLWWGPELIQVYNDAYMPSFGRGRHPAAMGQRGRDCWQEIWPIIWPQIDDVMQRGKASWNEDALVPIYRNERIEEVYWTYGYSPVFDDDGSIGGTLVVCTETTSRVLATRRSKLVRQLGDRLSDCGELEDISAIVRQAMREAKLDLPFLLTYRQQSSRSSSGHSGQCSGEWRQTGVTSSGGSFPSSVDGIVREHLELSATSHRGRPLAISVGGTFIDSAWPEPVTNAVIITPRRPGLESLVFGLSPRLQLDSAYRELFEQIVEQLELAAARLEAFRVRAEVESERRNLLLQAPVATALLIGPRHVFELANPLFREMTGGRDVHGKEYLEAFPEIAGTPLARVLDRVYETGESFVTHEYLIPLDRAGRGTLEDCYYKFSLEPVRRADGSVYGMMAVAVDITEQVNARMVLERGTLEREKLLTQLEAANQAKDEFLATVSHELRTPLTSILGWARLLGENSDPSRLARGLAVIERNAKAQAQLIDDILDVSRIISGKIRMNMRLIDPARVVLGATETIRPLARAKQLRLIVHIEEPLPPLVGDEDRLQQVVWNLLSNAVKFTAAGGEVTVGAAQLGSDVVISVRDSGKGINPDFLPHVFDRFRQDDTSTTKQHAGLGLGLAIVRHLVELHGGHVSAENNPGPGATFTVRLPIQSPDERGLGFDEGPPSELPAPIRTDAGQRLAGAHVLVVDDQDDARELVAAVLERAGARVSQAASVTMALQALASGSVSVMVSDIAMPEEDGYSLMRRLNSRGLPALALTAYARTEDRQKALAAGFHEHAAKPIDPNLLIDLVASLLSSSGQ
jgi:signal transduction histidine kinase/CheY-like chemotaxis protein